MRALAKILAALLLALPPSQTLAEKPSKNLTIGVVLPLSGANAEIGKQIRDGAILAQEESGIRATLQYEDADSTAKSALSAARKIELTFSPDFYFGPFGAGAGIAVASAMPTKLFLGVTNCDPKLNEYNNLLCIYPNYSQQMETLARYLRHLPIEQQPQRTLALLQEYESVYQTEGYLKKLQQEQIIGELHIERFKPEDMDFRSLLLKMRDADFLYVQGEFHQVTLAFRQAQQTGMKPRIRAMGADPVFRALKAEKELFQDVLLPGWFNRVDAAFRARFEERFDYLPNLYASLGYDSMASLLRAFAEDRNRSPKAMVEKLNTLRYAPVSSGFRFQPDRSLSLDLQLVRVNQGNLESAK
jgi:ABC-type branched-subunit amino acid transport system substrate-binding protein